MTLPSSRFLEPSTLSGIQDLRLVARAVVEGFLSGLHSDPRPAAGVEFSQYRTYEPGDDLRRVDWRAYARSDRFFVRQSQVEREVRVRFVMDATASMAHPDSGLTKFDYARLVVASLAYLVSRQGDRIGFHAIREASSVDLPPERRQRTLLALLDMLERLEPSGTWPTWEQLGSRLSAPRGREIVVLVSDLYDRGEEMASAITTLRAQNNEVLVLHLMGRNELDFPFRGSVRFEDLETGLEVRGSAEKMRAAYMEKLTNGLAFWRQRLSEAGISYELLPMDQPLDQALRSFLLRRAQLH